MKRRNVGSLWLCAAVAVWVAAAGDCTATGLAAPTRAAVFQRLNAAGVPFQEGAPGDARIAYHARTFGGVVSVTRDGAILYSLPGRGSDGAADRWCVIEETLVGAAAPAVAGQAPTAARFAVFRGRDPAQWRRDVKAFQSVGFGETYPGIELTLIAHGNNVEKVFRVAPGADPARIRLSVRGIESLVVGEDGALAMLTPLGVTRLTAPEAYQERAGVRTPVEVAYAVVGQSYGFRLGAYDAALPLVIDPLLASTFLGGSAEDAISDLVIDGSGNVYVCGATRSGAFPTTAGVYDRTLAGDEDVFVSKFSGNLGSLLASTLIGGPSQDRALALAFGSYGSVLVAGGTDSQDNFPVTVGAYDTTPGNWGGRDGFICKLDANLTTLQASTFLGGNTEDEITDIASDAAGHAYVAGWTQSAGFPVTAGSWDTLYNGYNGWTDYTVQVRVNATRGTANVQFRHTDLGSYTVYLAADGYLGLARDSDKGWQQLNEVATDLAGAQWHDVEVQAQGSTIRVLVDSVQRFSYTDTNLPVIVGGNVAFNVWAEDNNGLVYFDDLVVRTPAQTLFSDNFNDGNVSDWYLDSSSLVNLDGNYALRGTGGWGYAEPDNTQANSTDIFVAKLTPTLSALRGATFLGGSGNEQYPALALAGDGVYVVGQTESSDFPAQGAFDNGWNGGSDAFVAKFDLLLSQRIAATFLGGGGRDSAGSVVVTGDGSVYVAGTTESGNFPTTGGAFQTSKGSAGDAGFVSRFDSGLTALSASTYLQGGGADKVCTLSVAGDGSVYVAGATESAGLPTSALAYDRDINGGRDAFAARFSADLSLLRASTFLGGAMNDEAWALGVATDGSVYVAGMTQSSGFPKLSAYDLTHNGDVDGFVTKFDADLSGAPKPVIAVSARALNFGSVRVGSSATQTVTVLNVGNATLQAGTLALIDGAAAAGFTLRDNLVSGRTIAAGSSATVKIVFTPVALWGQSAGLSIPSNDPQTPTQRVSLYGTGVDNSTAEQRFQEGIQKLSSYTVGTHDTNDLLLAREKFTAALTANPNHYGACLYGSLTQFLCLFQDPQVNQMMSRFGAPVLGRDLFNWTAEAPDPLPVNAPMLSEASELAAQKVLAEIENAMTCLVRIPTGWTGSFLVGPDVLPIDSQVQVDAGDVQLFQCGLQMVKGVISFVRAYDWNVSTYAMDQLTGLSQADNDILRCLETFPNLGTVSNATHMATASQAFQLAIDRYLTASTLIRAETDYQVDDMVMIAPEDAADEEEARRILQLVKSSFTAPTVVDTPEFAARIHMARAFAGSFLTRDLMPDFDAQDNVIPGTFPDPTMNGLLPDFTQTRWSELIGVVLPVRLLAQRTSDGQAGLYEVQPNNSMGNYRQIFASLPGWVLRDIDGDMILMQQGDGGMAVVGQLNANGQPIGSAWKQITGPMASLVLSSLDNHRVLAQLGPGGPVFVVELDSSWKIAKMTRVNRATTGLLARSLDASQVLLQASPAGAAHVWQLGANGAVVNATMIYNGAIPGVLVRSLDKQTVLIQMRDGGPVYLAKFNDEWQMESARPVTGSTSGLSFRALD